MKLLRSIKSKVTKDENDENMLSLEMTEIVLIHCTTVNNNCQQYLRVLYTPSLNKLFVNY